ncbi:MAG: hypothetical protein WC091_07940 [Sulfuricellaceae bacterium]
MPRSSCVSCGSIRRRLLTLAERFYQINGFFPPRRFLAGCAGVLAGFFLIAHLVEFGAQLLAGDLRRLRRGGQPFTQYWQSWSGTTFTLFSLK